MSFISEEIVHVKGNPKKLVIFLHGYIDSASTLDKNLPMLIDKLDDVAIHIPEAPCECEIYSRKCQWYSMHRFDPDDERMRVKDFDKYVEIYNRMKPGLIDSFNFLEEYIEERLNMYGLTEKDLYVCGFSQGATLAIFTALRLRKKIAGCVSFSGILAPSTYLMEKYKSKPDILLIHNQDDTIVRFEALEFSKTKLQEIGCKVETVIGRIGQHRLTEKGLKATMEFISNKK